MNATELVTKSIGFRADGLSREESADIIIHACKDLVMIAKRANLATTEKGLSTGQKGLDMGDSLKVIIALSAAASEDNSSSLLPIALLSSMLSEVGGVITAIGELYIYLGIAIAVENGITTLPELSKED